MELVVVILTLAILAAAAAPRLSSSLNRLQAESAARRIRADLAWARQRAIAGSSTVTVQFSPASHSYQIPALPDLNHPGQPYAVQLASPPYHALLLSAALGGDADVAFSRFGQADSGGTITVRSGSFQQTVTVAADSGRATIP